MAKFIYFLGIILLVSSCSSSTKFEIVGPEEVSSIYLSPNEDPLIKWAVKDLAHDIEAITGKKISIVETRSVHAIENGIFVGQYASPIFSENPEVEPLLANQWEKFNIRQENKRLLVAGSDIRGTVYALFELAEQLGISPWKWWADVSLPQQEKLTLSIPKQGITQEPSVQFRGIFLNDEDWGLQPWAAKNFETETGDIGPKTYEKIFQLLLRLKANCIWPAMHHCTHGFFTIEGNREMAEKYHIAIGTSHAEPMLRNNVDEWKGKERGEFNYFTNSDNVKDYWQQRITETKNGNNIITMGMRGIHDSGMRGDATTEERVQILEKIIADQREMLSTTLEKPIEEIPQVFIPYKEVLDLYNRGLQVPEDITLMWTDDNYGYIRRLSNKEEQQRSGGSGIYYHISYWGRPHDYLWLSSTQPGLIWYELSRAYQNGAQKIWIINVGDIKPAEYSMELALDLGWDVNSITENTINNHLKDWCKREFGAKYASQMADLFNEYYRLAFIRKPEFMGWSQTERTTPVYPTAYSTLNDNELQRRIDDYKELYVEVDRIKTQLPAEKQDAFFQLVEYPVKGAALMNFKFLKAKQALLTEDEGEAAKLNTEVVQAYEEIKHLTTLYNEEISGGKWNHMMAMNPRRLPVYGLPDIKKKDIRDTESKTDLAPVFIQANEFSHKKDDENYTWKIIEGLGYSNAAVTLFPFTIENFETNRPTLKYEVNLPAAGDYQLVVRCLPNHANDYNFQLGLSANGEETKFYPLNTRGRSSEWKENVLRNGVLVSHPISIDEGGKQSIQLSVNQTGIVIDQLAVVPNGYGSFYELRAD